MEKPGNNETIPPLFQPIQVRGTSFRNRVFLSPMCQYASDEGAPTPWHSAHHSRFALGGLGGAMVESTGVTRDGRITPVCMGLWNETQEKGLSAIADIYHAQGVPVGIQLSHSGRKGSSTPPAEGGKPLSSAGPEQAWETVAPSAIPLRDGWPTPKALSEADIEDLIQAFVDAAKRAIRAGFDYVEIHGAHGYLIHSFMSPLANQRTDRWGGDLEGRMRFPLEIVKAVRKVIPENMPLFYRASVVDGLDGGLAADDTVVLAQRLKAAGVDVIDCSSGGITGASGKSFSEPYPGYLVDYSAQVKREAEILTMAVGVIVSAEKANDVIASGEADFVAIARHHLYDPSFAYHAAEELGHPDPESLLPDSYGMVLRAR